MGLAGTHRRQNRNKPPLPAPGLGQFTGQPVFNQRAVLRQGRGKFPRRALRRRCAHAQIQVDFRRCPNRLHNARKELEPKGAGAVQVVCQDEESRLGTLADKRAHSAPRERPRALPDRVRPVFLQGIAVPPIVIEEACRARVQGESRQIRQPADRAGLAKHLHSLTRKLAVGKPGLRRPRVQPQIIFGKPGLRQPRLRQLQLNYHRCFHPFQGFGQRTNIINGRIGNRDRPPRVREILQHALEEKPLKAKSRPVCGVIGGESGIDGRGEKHGRHVR